MRADATKVLEQSDDIVHALDVYDQACKYAPESPMVAFKRIRVLVALSRIDVRTHSPLSIHIPLLLPHLIRYGHYADKE